MPPMVYTAMVQWRVGGADNELSCVGLKALLTPSVGGLKALAARGLLQSNTMYGGAGVWKARERLVLGP